MITRVCPDCERDFSYTPNPNFPDKRKYCDDCGKKRKLAWEEAQNPVKAPENGPIKEREPSSRNTTMYVSYAKDLCVALLQRDHETHQIGDVMKLSIDLVKQARMAFE